MTTRLVLMLVTTLATHPVHADEFVDRADANGDGFVSLYELRAAYYADPEFNMRIERSFGSYDRNGDGLISDDERQTRRAELGRGTLGNAAQTQNSTSGVKPESVVSGWPERDPPRDASQYRSQPAQYGVDADEREEPAAEPAPVLARRPDRRREPVLMTGSSGIGQSDNTVISRNETWIMEIDADRSGGASMAELIASGDGQRWFSKAEFEAADKNDDGDLNANELAALVSSLERRYR